MNAPSNAPIREVKSPKKGIAEISESNEEVAHPLLG